MKTMETFEAIRMLLAMRAFRDTPIPDDVTREIVFSERCGQPFAQPFTQPFTQPFA